MKRLKIGIIGCGTIGSALARTIEKRFSKNASLVFLSELDCRKVEKLSKSLKSKPRVTTIRTLIKRCDFIIEAASAKVSGDIASCALRKNKNILVMSVGGLLGHDSLRRALSRTKGTLYIPSGAVAGVDGVLGAREGKIHSVTLITRKPPAGLAGAPFFKKSKIRLERLKTEKLLFDGNVIQAVKMFPKNVNVSALLAFAGIGPHRTRVKIYTSPQFKRNSHEIILKGECGTIHTRTDNLPSLTNPKTSALAINSAQALLSKIFSRFKIGV